MQKLLVSVKNEIPDDLQNELLFKINLSLLFLTLYSIAIILQVIFLSQVCYYYKMLDPSIVINNIILMSLCLYGQISIYFKLTFNMLIFTILNLIFGLTHIAILLLLIILRQKLGSDNIKTQLSDSIKFSNQMTCILTLSVCFLALLNSQISLKLYYCLLLVDKILLIESGGQTSNMGIHKSQSRMESKIEQEVQLQLQVIEEFTNRLPISQVQLNVNDREVSMHNFSTIPKTSEHNNSTDHSDQWSQLIKKVKEKNFKFDNEQEESYKKTMRYSYENYKSYGATLSSNLKI